MGPDPQSDGGLLAAFVDSARRHPGVSVPVGAGVLAASLGFSVSVYTFAATVAQAEDLHVPEGFVPVSSQAELVGRGVIVVGLLALLGFMVIVLLGLLARRFRGTPSQQARRRRLTGWLADLGPGFELSARAAGLVAVTAGVSLLWLNAVVLAAFLDAVFVREHPVGVEITLGRLLAPFLWTPNPIGVGWVVEETFGTDTPVLVLEDENGEVLLRPLTDLGEDRFAACGPVTRSVAGGDQELRYDENLGRLVDVEEC